MIELDMCKLLDFSLKLIKTIRIVLLLVHAEFAAKSHTQSATAMSTSSDDFNVGMMVHLKTHLVK